MSITVIISHLVEDFDRWKIGIDDHESVRAEAKMQAKAHRSAGDPNHVYVISAAESKEAFDAFTSSPDLTRSHEELWGDFPTRI